MKAKHRLRHVFWAILLAPLMSMGQNYNNTHSFVTAYQNSTHTCGVQTINSTVVEGGTINDPINGWPVVEIGRVNMFTGAMTPSPFYYTNPGMDHKAVDLVESTTTPNWVIVASDIFDPFTQSNYIGVFKVDPATGAIAWSLQFRNQNYDMHASAITRDNVGNFYVLGQIYGNSGIRDIYLISLTDAGAVNWERWYFRNNTAEEFASVDLLYDGVNIILAANYSVMSPTGMLPSGFIVGQVAPATGIMGPVRHLIAVDSISDLEVRDMDLVNGNYVIVGKINAQRTQGFLVQYLPGMTLFPAFCRRYSAPRDIELTGVKPAPSPNINVSFDHRPPGPGGVLFPGLAELTFAGDPITSFTYNVPGFIGSRGLIGVAGFAAMTVKGATNAAAPGLIPSLSMTGQLTPLVGLPPICNSPLVIDTISGAADSSFKFASRTLQQDQVMNLVIGTVTGVTYDCFGILTALFRQKPTGIENTLEGRVGIYPNPSNGLVTLEFNKDMVDALQVAEIYNTLGEVVLTLKVSNTTERIDLSGQSPGLYLLRMKSADGSLSQAGRILIK